MTDQRRLTNDKKVFIIHGTKNETTPDIQSAADPLKTVNLRLSAHINMPKYIIIVLVFFAVPTSKYFAITSSAVEF